MSRINRTTPLTTNGLSQLFCSTGEEPPPIGPLFININFPRRAPVEILSVCRRALLCSISGLQIAFAPFETKRMVVIANTEIGYERYRWRGESPYLSFGRVSSNLRYLLFKINKFNL